MKLSISSNQYPAYKDSGVEYIGRIPEGWNIKRLKYFSTLKARVGFHGLSSEDFVEEGPYCITGTDFKEGHISFENCYHVSEYWYHLDENIKLKNGDVLITKDGTIGKVAVLTNLEEKATLNSGVFVLRPTINGGFLYWQLNSVIFKRPIDIISRGSTINHLYERDFKNFHFLIPPVPEQTAIARFLDEKTSKIDQAITQKEQLIALLKERKQIMIQELVTGKKVWNGTTWAAPEKTKDSGVDWIGEIPEGWEVKTNNLLFQERKEPGQEGLPLLSVSIHTAVSSEEIDSTDNIQGRIKIEDKSKYKFVKSGDIVFNMMRAWQGAIGAVRVDGMVSPAYIVACPLENFNSDFLEFQYRTPDYIQQIDRFSKGITDFRKRLYWDEFKQLNVILPTREIQDLISDFIHSESSKIDQSISLQEQQIEKLREYKATLIDSAVTGKIKVPGV